MKANVLIIDDEPNNLKILQIRLGRDYELREATSGEQALEILADFLPAVMISDIMLPGIDGFELTKKIRSLPHHALTKIILVSGKSEIDDKLTGYRCGADDYLTKPFNGEELKAKLQTYVKMYQLERQLREINESLESEVKLRSDQLFTAERDAFVGRNAAEVVHNLKNPMAILKFYIGHLQAEQPGNVSLAKMDKAADKILLFIKDILNSKLDSGAVPAAADLNEMIADELEFIKINNQMKHNLATEIHLGAKNKIYFVGSHAHQILGNLIKNAAEALDGIENGKVILTTHDQGEFVAVKIADNGVGIPPENLNKIFNSLFTTKTGENGGPAGTGLGLFYCKKMIESAGGKIEVNSTHGKGTEIVVLFPAAK